jgi:hypothetical protein
MKKIIELMNEQRDPITKEVVDCKELLVIWKREQQFRLLEYGLNKPLHWNNDEECLKALDYLQSFNATVKSKLEETRLSLCNRQSKLDPIFRRLKENSTKVHLEGSEDVEDYCKRIVTWEYERQEELTKEEVFWDLPQLEVVYPTILHLLTLEYQRLWSKVEMLMGKLSQAYLLIH